MNVYKFKASGAASVLLQVKAQRVYYRQGALADGATDDTIILQSQGGGEYLILRPGEGSDVDGDVTDWIISNASGVGTINGSLVFGRGSFTSNRLTGTVDVLDGGKARTIAGNAYSAYVGLSAAAGNYPAVQLWNKSTNKLIVVESIALSSPNAGASAEIRHAAVPLAALHVSQSANKKIGTAGSAAVELRTEQFGVKPVTDLLFATDLPAGAAYSYDLTEPIVVVPGAGVSFIGGVAATRINVNFEFFEEATTA